MNINRNSIVAPLVIFFGPKGSGKTMALLRVLDYLFQQGYSFRVNQGFRADIAYQKTISEFNELLYNLGAIAPRTVDCVLVDIFYNNTLQFHILEAQGEDFYLTTGFSQNMPAHLQTLFRGGYPKVWVFFFEDNMFFPIRGNSYSQGTSPQTQQQNYLGHVKTVLQHYAKPGDDTRQKDEVIFLFNKADKMSYGSAQQESQILQTFNASFGAAWRGLPSFIKPTFLPFSAGWFPTIDQPPYFHFIKGEDEYPYNLLRLFPFKHS